jgi:hypothetical protein
LKRKGILSLEQTGEGIFYVANAEKWDTERMRGNAHGGVFSRNTVTKRVRVAPFARRTQFLRIFRVVASEDANGFATVGRIFQDGRKRVVGRTD